MSDLDPRELRVDVITLGVGPTRYVRVRIIHVPTGLTAIAKGRSQLLAIKQAEQNLEDQLVAYLERWVEE